MHFCFYLRACTPINNSSHVNINTPWKVIFQTLNSILSDWYTQVYIWSRGMYTCFKLRIFSFSNWKIHFLNLIRRLICLTLIDLHKLNVSLIISWRLLHLLNLRRAYKILITRFLSLKSRGIKYKINFLDYIFYAGKE